MFYNALYYARRGEKRKSEIEVISKIRGWVSQERFFPEREIYLYDISSDRVLRLDFS